MWVGVFRTDRGRCWWVCLGRREEGVGVSWTRGGRCRWVCLGRREEGVGGCV